MDARRETLVAQREAELALQETDIARQQTELARRDSELAHQQNDLARHQTELAQHQAELAQRETELAQRENELAQRETELGQQQTELAQREAELRQRETELGERETELAEEEAQWAERATQQQAVASCVEAEATQVAKPYGHAPASQVRGPVPQPAAVNGGPQFEDTRTVAAVHGRHDMERMAIRAVTDVLGNTITETVHERLRRNDSDCRPQDPPSEAPTQLERLKEENAGLTRSNSLLKAAAALLAAALDTP